MATMSIDTPPWMTSPHPTILFSAWPNIPIYASGWSVIWPYAPTGLTRRDDHDDVELKRLVEEYNTETLISAGTQTTQSGVPTIDNSCHVFNTVYSRLNIPCQHFSQATYAQCLMLHSRHRISDNLSEKTNKQTNNL